MGPLQYTIWKSLFQDISPGNVVEDDSHCMTFIRKHEIHENSPCTLASGDIYLLSACLSASFTRFFLSYYERYVYIDVTHRQLALGAALTLFNMADGLCVAPIKTASNKASVYIHL